MVGLSISACIQDIINDRVDPNDVEYIIAGTCCETNAQFYQLLKTYQSSYWYHTDLSKIEDGKAFALKLWREHKILQPRLQDGPVPNISGGRHWVK